MHVQTDGHAQLVNHLYSLPHSSFLFFLLKVLMSSNTGVTLSVRSLVYHYVILNI